MPDREDSAAAIAHRSLEPLLTRLFRALDGVGAADVAEAVLSVTAEAYATGHRDGVRHAVADIAPIAEAHGLRLWLGPDLRDDDPDGEDRARTTRRSLR